MTPRWIRAALVLCVLPLLVGCAATAARQTDLMERAGSSVSKRELQVLTHELVTRVTGIIEVTATHMYRNADDRQLRYRAAGWPTYAVPEFQWATLREDPLVGVVNGWIFAAQMTDFFETGLGKDYFGEFQPRVVESCKLIEAEFERTARYIRDEDTFPRTQQLVDRYARNHPIRNPLFARASPESLVTLAVSGPSGGLRAASEMNDQMRELSDRIGIYTRTLPRQINWQSTVLVDQIFVRLREERDSIIVIMQAETDALMAQAFDQVGNERDLILAAVAQERALITELLQAERQIIFDAITAERTAALDQIQTITDETVKSATGDVTNVAGKAIDHAFARGLQLGGVALAGVLLLIIVAWLVIRRDLRRAA